MDDRSRVLYAWVGPDKSGEEGLLSFQSSLGVSGAAFSKRTSADLDLVREQVQARADILGITVRLVRFEEAEVLETLHPRSN